MIFLDSKAIYNWSKIGDRYLSGEREEVMPGVVWGSYYQLYTPAFWKVYYEVNCEIDKTDQAHKIGSTIIEEIVACILGGYGIPAEVGLEAFKRLKDEGIIKFGVNQSIVLEALKRPLTLPSTKQVKYRFAGQKARYITALLNRKDLNTVDALDDVALRNWLITVEGIGPKTASWITRNWLSSERVAILDIHLLRAGKIAGFFNNIEKVETNYYQLEKRFLSFCSTINVLPSRMDALIWRFMKETNHLAIKVLKQ